MNVGDTVKVKKIPQDLPDDVALQRLFKGCLGKSFEIVAFDDDLAELHVGEAFGEAKDRHRIWLPVDCLSAVKA